MPNVEPGPDLSNANVQYVWVNKGMHPSEMAQDNDQTTQQLSSIPMLIVLLVTYIILRVLAWTNTELLEDHDSILYVQQIAAFLTFDPTVIGALSPDSTPFYPFFGALASLPGWSPEFGARLCSLIFSVGLFIGIAGILQQVTDWRGAAIGLLILCISPYMITFSISILSEPAYVAVTYLGLWYFLIQRKQPTLLHAAGLGIIFGFTFLNRLEGLLFLPLIPFLQGLAFIGEQRSFRKTIRHFMAWTAIYVAGFLIVAAPQVFMVSDKMDRFALNGRQVWAEILLSPSTDSYEKKIYGLDYSPTEINLTYLQKHPTKLAEPRLQDKLFHDAETVLRNVDKFYSVQVGRLGGSLLVAFCLFGVLQLYKSGKTEILLILVTFLGVVLIPGILTDPKPRAVAVAVPLLAALSGPGIVFIAAQIERARERRLLESMIQTALIGFLMLVWLVPFGGIYLQDRRANVEYSLDELRPIQDTLWQVSRERGLTKPIVSARKQYLPYLAGARFVPLPYSDYDALLRYCKENDVDFLFLQHRELVDFPFMDQFRERMQSDELELVYSGRDGFGERMELYLIP